MRLEYTGSHGAKMFSEGLGVEVVGHKCSWRLELSAGGGEGGAGFGKMGKYLSVPFSTFRFRAATLRFSLNDE